MEWKWSNGEKCERSPKYRKVNEETKDKETDKETKDNTINHLDKFNKREETYNRMSERELVSRVPLNPFFTINKE
jgi:hypothetical protein